MNISAQKHKGRKSIARDSSIRDQFADRTSDFYKTEDNIHDSEIKYEDPLTQL